MSDHHTGVYLGGAWGGTAAAKTMEKMDGVDQVLYVLGHLSIADCAGIMTLIYTAWIFGCSIYDRIQKRKRGA